ncbi:MAG: nuclear transport factor 2 family protein [Acidobacteriota bacterium]
MSSQDSSAEAEIRELIKGMNNAWAMGHPEDIGSFFREDIVMVLPGFQQRTGGREACVASYVDFCNQAAIAGLTLGEISVDVFGDTAVASYGYEISYELGGERFNDKGRDIIVFVRGSDGWQAVWRTMIVTQPESVN